MDKETSSHIGPTIFPITYQQIQDQDRLWISFLFGGPDAYRNSLIMIDYLEQFNIPWARQPQIEYKDSVYDYVCIAIPILVAWMNYIPFQHAIGNIKQFSLGRLIIKDSMVPGPLLDWENFDSNGNILRFGKWFKERPIDSMEHLSIYLAGSRFYGDVNNIDCFEEIFYLYHCGVFDSCSEEVKGRIKEYIDERKYDPPLKAKYFKILY